MFFRNIFLALLLLFTSLSASAQQENKTLKRAEALESKMAYAEAITNYEGFLQKETNIEEASSQRVKLRLANLYYLVKDYENAERLFAEVLTDSPELSGDEEIKYYLKYAQVLSSNGKHSQAAIQWKKYSSLKEEDNRPDNFVKLYSNLDALTKNAPSYNVEYIGINTASPDFSPAYYEGGMVFVSGREERSAIRRVFSWDNSSFLNLYLLEDLSELGKNSSSVSSGGDEEDKGNRRNLNKLGSDYYTAPTANDTKTMGRKGSPFINGSSDYSEMASVETRKFSKSLNSKYHEGPCSFFNDGKTVVFTRNAVKGIGLFSGKRDEVTRLNLYFADKSKRDWNNIRSFAYNNPNYSTGHPAINSADNVLYFVSDMPGGLGGTDIYFSVLRDGEWAEPVNMGGLVNTKGNEMFPFLDEDDNLYFSSDGHPGLGDLDIFYTQIDSYTHLAKSKIRNLGAPLNSNRDDFGIVTDGERVKGYFSSNRKRGGADDDIYKFERLGDKYGCRELLLSVIDKTTKQPISNISFSYQKIGPGQGQENAMVNSNGNIKLCLSAESEYYLIFNNEDYKPLKKYYTNLEASDFEPTELSISLQPLNPIKPKAEPFKKPESNKILTQKRDLSDENIFKGVILQGENQSPIAGVKVRFINKCSGEIQEVLTNPDGSYTFDRDPECDYELVALKNSFATSFELIEKSINRNIFNRKKKVASNYPGPKSLFDTKLYKVGDVVQLENIYFKKDSYKLERSAEESVDDLVSILKKYPNMIIEIFAHTDTRGNSLDNLYLSQLRAKEVEKYLSKRGVSKLRIKAVGMGEKQPLNNCGDGVQCTEAEHERNRRTEFKILQMQKVF